MKRLILISVFAVLGVNLLFAQLKVKEDGDIHIGNTPTNELPCIYLGFYQTPLHPEHLNGEWGFETWNGDFNIWKPWPSPFANERNYYLHISKYGNVGVGKIASYKLDVLGDIATNGVLRISSDERLKTNIQKVSSIDYNKIYQLQAVSYSKFLPKVESSELNKIKKIPTEELEYQKETKRETQEIGFLAQELMKIYPELVAQDKEGYYSINYIGLIPVLVEAIKELKHEITELRGGVSIGKPISKANDNTGNLADTQLAILYQNAPNPFSQSTRITYYIPNEVNQALLCIYDMQGNQLRQIALSVRGEGSVTVHGSELTAGIYLYALLADGKEVDVKRMILTE